MGVSGNSVYPSNGKWKRRCFTKGGIGKKNQVPNPGSHTCAPRRGNLFSLGHNQQAVPQLVGESPDMLLVELQ